MQGSLFALSIFILVSSITPGPNNLMLLHGGIHKGFVACVPHIFGISSGMVVMIVCSYWGMAKLVTQWPLAMTMIKMGGTGYLLWLAWVMGREGVVPTQQQTENVTHKTAWQLPLTYWQAMLFQWINPKAWMMVVMLPSLAIMAGDNMALSNSPIYLLSFLINICCITVWAVGGNGLRHFLHRRKTMRLVHIMIVLMTIYCALAIWL